MSSFSRLYAKRRSLFNAAGLTLLSVTSTDSQNSKSLNGRELRDVYDVLDNKPIGMGGFGVVCPGRHRTTGETVAIKSVSKTKINKDRMLREAEIMRLCGDHHFVADFVDLFESDSHWYLITEMASGGELFDRLITRGPYTEAHACVLIREVAEALAYIHHQGVVHFDLKPENILIHSKGLDTSKDKAFQETTRIIDFGSSFMLSEPVERRVPSTGSGTSAYLPPEALVDEGERGPCDTSADMWSLGLVMYIILAGAHPFDLENRASDKEVEDKILHDPVTLQGGNWDKISVEAKDLLRQLLSKNPSERPSATKVLQHSWMIGGALANKVPLEDAGENLRKFHRGRRRLKALLLATMLGLNSHSEKSKVSEVFETSKSQKFEDPLGSRLQALKVFDRTGKGVISGEDLARVVKSVGDELTDVEILEMLRAADQNPRTTQKVIQPEQMLKLVPPISPPKTYDNQGYIFRSGQTDPQAYLITEGNVLLSFTPKDGGRVIASESVGRGELIGDSELLAADGSVSPRLHNAQCVSCDGCKLLAIGKDLFSHLTDVFETLGEVLLIRANNHLHSTFAQWLKHVESTTLLYVMPGENIYPASRSNIEGKTKNTSSFFWSGDSVDNDLKSPHIKGINWGPLSHSIETTGCLIIIERGECEVELSFRNPSEYEDMHQQSECTYKEAEQKCSTPLIRRVGPGFVCYCGPPRQSVGEKQVPVSLKPLPRCVRMKAVGGTCGAHSGNKDVDTGVIATAIAGQELHELLKQPGMSVLRDYVSELVTNSDAGASHLNCQLIAISKCFHQKNTK